MVTDGLPDAPVARPVVDLQVPAAPLKAHIVPARARTAPDKVQVTASLVVISVVTLQIPIAPAAPAAGVALVAPWTTVDHVLDFVSENVNVGVVALRLSDEMNATSSVPTVMVAVGL
jgi:hypothetical protein